MTLSTFAQLETSSNMKKRFTLKRSRTKDRDEDLQEISLDILLAHKDDVICKVLYNQFAFCEAQGKGRARGGPRKVTQRSFMDGGWWISFP